MWFWTDEPWQYRVLDALPPGVDLAQLQQALRMTPTERVEAVVALMRAAETLARGRREGPAQR
jgi:hypothetical protein